MKANIHKRLSSRRKGTAKTSLTPQQLEKCSAFFDISYYRNVSDQPDITEPQGLLHYLQQGWRDGLDPSDRFSTSAYLELYPDVAQEGVNPLLHYVSFGVNENRIIQKKTFEGEVRFEKLTLTEVQGWALDKHNPELVVALRLFIDGQFYTTLRADKPRPDLNALGLGGMRGGFALDIPFHLFEPGEVLVEVEAPDGNRTWRKIAVAPRVEHRPRVLAPALTNTDAENIKVIVPIYNAIDDARVCIERLRDHTPAAVEILLIDDCSTDPAIGDLLDTVRSEPRFRVLRNDTNLGFTRTVNRGFAAAGTADVILLNSDARVTPRWVEGLHAAACSRDKVATVTAMSDRAGAFSAPTIGNDNPLPPGLDEIKFARAFRRRSLRLYPQVPTGNGFCMYVTRSAVDALGAFDEDAFPRGYGEENDFCMRALRAGWSNLVDDATYVFHDRSKSFGDEKTENIAQGRQIVDQRYPEYKLLIETFRSGPAFHLARYRARLALADCCSGNDVLPRALFVVATQTGGTPQTNADLMDALGETFECLVLRCDSRKLELSQYRNGKTEVLRSHQLGDAIEPLTHRSGEYDAVVSHWLAELDIDIVHIRHLGWHSLSLPELGKRAGARVVFSFHDFYALCPSLKLLDDNDGFCGGTCTAGDGMCNVELWSGVSLPPLKNRWVHYWRARMEQALSFCDAFVTTSPAARDRIARAMPSLPDARFHVIPHGRNFDRFEDLQHLPNGDGPVRILVPGNINNAKGLQLIARLLELDRLGEFEFHVLGDCDLKSLDGPKPARLHLHGRYGRSEFAMKVHAIAPHFGAVFSIWDETYCHTLTELWSVGLPAAVLDFPTLRRRMEDCGAGWVLEDMTPEAVLQSLRAIAADREGLAEKGKAAIRWQMRRGTAQSCRQMAARYLDVYRLNPAAKSQPKIGICGPSNRDLYRGNASTEIRLWERTRNRLDRPVDYVRATPAGLIAKMRIGMVAGAIVQRTALPSALVDPFLEAARDTQTPYLFELDDHLLQVPADIDETGFYAAYAPHLESLLRSAAGVIVSTPALAEEIRSFNPNVHVIENRISARLWSGAVGRTGAYPAPNLLYMGGTTHDEDLAFALEAITIARQRRVDLRLTLIGVTSQAHDLPDWVDVVDVPAEQRSYNRFVPWLKDQAATATLGIAPLIDNGFNRFKSDLKVLDYGALGLPVIASRVESFRTFDGEHSHPAVILLPNNAEVWAQEIVKQLSAPDELRAHGEALKTWIFANRRTEDDMIRYDDLVLAFTGGDDFSVNTKSTRGF